MRRKSSAFILAAFLVGVSASPGEAQTATEKCLGKSGQVWLVYSGTSEAGVRAARVQQELPKTFAANTSDFKVQCQCDGNCSPSTAFVDSKVTALPKGEKIKLGDDCIYEVIADAGVGVTILKGDDSRLKKTPAANNCSDNDYFIKVPYQVACRGKCG